MFRWIRIIFKLSMFLAALAVFFSLLLFAAKIWGIYSAPPSEKFPKGVTLIVTRNEDEPFLNAPDRPKREVIQPQGTTPNMFGSGPIKRKPIEQRIVARFPFSKWVHEKAKDTTVTVW